MVDTVKTVKSAGGDYSSLSAWEAGQQKAISAGDSEQAECYSFSDTTALVIDGWTTAADAYIRIYTPASERHDGKWNASKYRLETTTTNSCSENYVRFDGIQFSLNSATAFRYCLAIVGAASDADGCRVDACIAKRIGSGTDQYGFRVIGGSVENYIRNCVAYDFNSTGSVGFHTQMVSGQARLDNNTAHNCTLGFSTGYQDTIIRNCLAASCTDGFSATGDWYTGSNYNASSNASDAPGANSRNSQTFTFVDEAGDDFHLASTDAGALGYGQDLSATFTIDIDGQTRSGTWDIAADEYVAAGASAALTGAAATAAAGIMISSLGYPLTGSAASAASGNMVSALSYPVNGEASTLSPGTLVSALGQPLTGAAGTFAAGTLAAAISQALTGSGMAAAAGTVLAEGGDVRVTLSGAAVTVSAGTLVSAISHSTSGGQIATAAGTLVVAIGQALSGSAATAAGGSLAAAISQALSGSQIIASVGTVTVEGVVSTTAQTRIYAIDSEARRVAIMVEIRTQNIDQETRIKTIH